MNLKEKSNGQALIRSIIYKIESMQTELNSLKITMDYANKFLESLPIDDENTHDNS